MVRLNSTTYVFPVDSDPPHGRFLNQPLGDFLVAAHDRIVQRRPTHFELPYNSTHKVTVRHNSTW